MGKELIEKSTHKATIMGHEAQRLALKRLLLARKLPSTIMFSGISGIGKKLVAKELCRTLLCEENNTFFSDEHTTGRLTVGGCSQCKACHLFDIGNLPDFYPVECKNQEKWNTASIRELLYSLNLVSFSSLNRVILFDDADYLAPQAANVLLKILEEPRKRTFFILVCSNPSKLPQTVVSRCQLWFFNELDPKQIELIIKTCNIPSLSGTLENLPLDELAILADGSLENLDGVVNDLESWRNVRFKLEGIFSGDAVKAIEFARELAKDKEKLPALLRLLRIYARERMLESSSNYESCIWSICLSNLLFAERLIFERNISAIYVLQTVFLNLLPEKFYSIANSEQRRNLLLEQAIAAKEF